MLEEILQEIKKMGCPSEGIGCGLEDAGITDRYEAAAYGFEEARDRILEIICDHGDGGWIPCSERLPENEQKVEITYTWKNSKGKSRYGVAMAMHEDGTVLTEDSDMSWEDVDNFEYCAEKDDSYIPEGWWECVAFGETFSAVDQEVIAWRPCPEPYRPGQKGIGEDYKSQIMDRFLRVE